MRYALIMLFVLSAGCDATSNAPPCVLETDDTFTFSTPFLTRTNEAVALFEFQQEIQTYQTGECTRTEADVNEVSLVVRNLTACVHTLSFTISLIKEGQGFSIEGNANIQPGAAQDLGLVQSGSPITIDNAQSVVTGISTLTACP